MKQQLNLLPLDKRPAPAKPPIAFAVLAPLIYLVAILSLWTSNVMEIKKLDVTIDKLSQSKAQMQKHLAVPPPQPPKVDTVSADVLTAMRGTPPWDTILAELSIVIPKAVWLDLVESPDAKNMRLKGYAKNQSAIAEFISRLERSMYFTNVQIVYSQKGPKASTFELRARIQWT